jgi:hypothetical protein
VAHLVFGYAPAEIGRDIAWWEERIYPEDRQGVVDGMRRAAIAVSSASVLISWFMAFSLFEIRYTADDAQLARHPPYDL